MDLAETKLKKGERNQYRVYLKADTFARVGRWAEQIRGQRKGVKVRAADLVEFALMSRSEEFTNSEVKEYQERYTSDIDLAKWLVKELTAAEKRGEKVSLSDLVVTSKGKPPSERVPAKRRESLRENSLAPEVKSELDQKLP